MNYKNFFIILIIIIPFQSFSSENDEYLSLETWKVYGQGFLSACLKADYAKNFVCSEKENALFFSKIDSFDQCKKKLKESVHNGFIYKNIENEFKKNSRSYIDNLTELFETLKKSSKNKTATCSTISSGLKKTFKDYLNIINNGRPAYLTTIESTILQGKYVNLHPIDSKEYLLTIFNQEESLLDESFLYSFNTNIAAIFPKILQIKLWKYLKSISKYSKVKDYSTDKIDGISKSLEVNGPQPTDFHKNNFIDLTRYDLDSPVVLFEVTKDYFTRWVRFNDTNFSVYEGNKIVDAYKYSVNYMEPLNRLDKLKDDIKKPISFNFMILFNDISSLIKIPNDISKSLFYIVNENQTSSDEVLIEKFTLRESNFIKSITPIIEQRDNYSAYNSQFWITSNEKLKKKYIDIGIIKDINKLKQLTIDYIKDYQKNVSIALSEDLYAEAIKQINIDQSIINEYAAQELAEQAIKVAKIEGSFLVEEKARGLISGFLMHSYNPKIRNTNLGKIHLEETLNMWLTECKFLYYFDDLLNCFENSFNRPNDESIGNVLKLIYEDENIYDYDNIISELHIIYKKLNSHNINHVSLSLKKPNEFSDKKVFLAYLDSEYASSKDERILETKCDYMHDRYNDFSPKDVIDCYENLIDITFETEDKNITAEYGMRQYQLAIDIIKKYIDNGFVVNNNFDLDEHFGKSKFKASITKPKKMAKDKYALIIGNSSYENKLDSTINDADVIEKKLKEIGFITRKYTDLTTSDFENKIIEFGIEAKKASKVVFYYSGHAFETGGLNYLLPVNINFNLGLEQILSSSIELNRVIKKNLPGKNKLIFLDACRNNPFNKNGLASLNLGDNTLVSFAAGFDQFSFVGEDLSPYSKYLSKYIQNNESINEVLRKVRRDVKEHTKNKQIPEEYSNLTDKIVLSD